MTSDMLAALEGSKYINLETFRRDGKGVAAPVWFMIEGQNVVVVTRSDTGKVKRLKNNNLVRIMPSGFRGEPKGEWMTGKARFANSEELKRALQLRSKKYGIQARIAAVVSSSKGSPVAILITLD